MSILIYRTTATLINSSYSGHSELVQGHVTAQHYRQSHHITFSFTMAQQPLVGQGLLIIEVPR
jgi:hypothetical protein